MMKKGNVRRVVFFAGIAVLALLALGIMACDLDGEGDYSYMFRNQPSYTVTISCSELKPSSFSVGPGNTRTATSDDYYINILYTPANLVIGQSDNNGTFYFYNK